MQVTRCAAREGNKNMSEEEAAHGQDDQSQLTGAAAAAAAEAAVLDMLPRDMSAGLTCDV